jgi:chitinase
MVSTNKNAYTSRFLKSTNKKSLIMRYLVLLLTSFLFVGCGGGGVDSPPVSPAKTYHEYLPLDPENKWYYNYSSTPVQPGSAISVAGHSVNPLIHPTGGKEYLLSDESGLYLAGVYAVQVIVYFSDGSSRNYTADAKFSTLLAVLPDNLMPGQSISSQGNGTVNIQPEFGNQSLSYSGTSYYIADEQVTVPYGTFDTRHIEVTGAINISIQGNTVTYPISMELWLAKNIGIVKRIEQGQVFELTDANISISNSTPSSDPPQTNINPVANAGSDQTVISGTTVNLNGSGSDEDGTITSYLWEQVGGPANITLQNETSPAASFIAPQVETDTDYIFNFTVEDEQGSSDTTQVTVTITRNVSADAGVNQSVNENESVQLQGNGATLEGTVQSWLWEQTAGPTVTLENFDNSTATFLAPEVESDTTLTFLLTVTDSMDDSATDSVNVVIRNVNKIPDANAGDDQSLDEKQTVNLTGSGSDMDGTIVSYQWQQTVGQPSVTIASPSSAVASFFAPDVITDTTFSFILIVTDNNGATTTDTVDILVRNVNVLPEANAGTNISADENIVVTLSGSASDADGSIVDYSWTQSGGSVSVTIENATSPSASFTAPDVDFEENLTLSFQLTVTDNNGATATDFVDVNILFVNEPPIASAGADQAVTDSGSVSLSASGSIDNDSNIVEYQWRQVSGTTVELSTPTSVDSDFTAPAVTSQEDLVFEIEVTDEHGGIDTDTIEVSVVPNDGATHDLTGLPFSVVDAEYSDSLESIVMVSADPAQLHIFNTRSNTLSSVALPLAPTAVAVTLDGEFAATGHNGWVSYVDLVNNQVIKTISVTTDVFDIVTAGDGYIHAIPRIDQWERVRSVSIETEIETLHQGGSIRAGTKVKLHPNGIWFYGADRGLSPSDIEKYDISDGAAVQYLYDSPYHGDFAMCGDLWISEDGLRIFTACGNVFKSSSERTLDMTYNGKLEGVTSIRSLSHSAETDSVLSFSGATDAAIKSSNYQFLTFVENIPLPLADNGVATFPNYGRFIFHKSSGSRYFAIVQADPAAGLLNDFSIVSSRSELTTP